MAPNEHVLSDDRTVNIQLKGFSHERQWVTFGTASVIGSAFLNNQYKDSLTLARMLHQQANLEDVIEVIQRLNGFFALIVRRSGWLIAVVDRIRSIPLYYAVHAGGVLLSDDASWVKNTVGDDRVDAISRSEYLHAGYVTLGDTLIPSVKQLRAGEMLIARWNPQDAKAGVEVSTRSYFIYSHSYTEENASIDALDSVVLEICERLVTVAGGRQIVVPLSGGLDSRLIVLQLKRMGYDNLVAFSYGKPGNPESEISQSVAASIKIPWMFVPYTTADWYHWFRTEERKAYYRMADGLSSLPHIQDWPAVWMLRSQKAIEDDAIIVPGHSADLPAGSRSVHPVLSKFYEDRAKYDLDAVINAILEFHFSLQGGLNQSDDVYGAIRKKVEQALAEIPHFETKDGASLTESWDWRERQAKFIVNSVRVYDFWGYDWWLPFWDKSFMAFWSGVGLAQRKGKHLYDSYVHWLMRQLGVAISDGETSARIRAWFRSQVNRGWGRLKDTRYQRLMRKARWRYKKWLGAEYENHPLAWYGVMSKRTFAKLYTGKEQINSFLALERLGIVTFDG